MIADKTYNDGEEHTYSHSNAQMYGLIKNTFKTGKWLLTYNNGKNDWQGEMTKDRTSRSRQ